MRLFSAGNNRLEGGLGRDYLIGLDGDDILDGGLDTPNTMQGGTGSDVYLVHNAGDSVIEFAEEGIDSVETALANYQLQAWVENLVGTSAVGQRLTGNELANAITGGLGNDVLDGKGGNDVIDGGGGADNFVFSSALNGVTNIDTIVGFQAGIDKIWLDDAVFAGFARGALAAGAFRTGAAAQDADDRIIYDPNTGSLFFDADGSGAGAAVQFAILGQGMTLNSGDFLVI